MSNFINQLVMTSGVYAEIDVNEQFFEDVKKAICAYASKDWGISKQDSVDMNNIAVDTLGYILAVYETCKGSIFIITDQGHEVTTVLFTDEY